MWRGEHVSLPLLLVVLYIGRMAQVDPQFRVGGIVPFYRAGRENGSDARRPMLLVSYCFPPDRTVGALRWQKLTRFAVERGWQLDVLTLQPAAGVVESDSGLADLPVGTRVFGIPHRRSFVERLENVASGLYSFLKTRARSPRRSSELASAPSPAANAARVTTRRPDTLAVEDLRWFPRSFRDVLRAYFAWAQHSRLARWSRDAARAGITLSRAQNYTVIVSSGPPHTTHAAAQSISRAIGVPYVLDLRDPWSHTQRLPESLASPVFVALASRDERRCLKDAALVVANTSALQDALATVHPGLHDRLIAVRNGCDDDPIPASRPSREFVIRFAGTVYFERDPRMLFRGAARAIRQLGVAASELRIEFVGVFDSAGGLPISAIAREEGIAEFVSVGPPRPHREALEFFGGATMLVTLPGYNSAMTIPAKTFEYVRFDAWILAITEPGTPLARLLEGTDADVVAPEDVDAIAAAIRARYSQHAAGIRPKALGADGRFDRSGQARLLFDAIDRVARPTSTSTTHGLDATESSRAVRD